MEVNTAKLNSKLSDVRTTGCVCCNQATTWPAPLRPRTSNSNDAMILLPLFIFWAYNPMHFGRPLRYATLAAILFISLVAPAFSTVLAADGNGAPNQPDSLNGAHNASQGKPHQEPRHIREGTTFENITGRFTNVGSRWVFIPIREDSVAPNDPSIESNTFGQKRSTAIIFESRSGSGREISITTSTQQRSRLNLVKEYAPDNATITAAELPQLIVVENLMLQRVVESMRADASEATWIVSGEVKEYFDDNVVMLRAAQRAVSINP